METQDIHQQIDKLLGPLRTLRDELRVRAHLGNMEMKDALRDLEGSLDGVERMAKHAADSALTAVHELHAKFLPLRTKLASGAPSNEDEAHSAR